MKGPTIVMVTLSQKHQPEPVTLHRQTTITLTLISVSAWGNEGVASKKGGTWSMRKRILQSTISLSHLISSSRM